MDVSSSSAPPASSDIKDPTRIHLIKFLTVLESLEWILANPTSKEPPFGLDDTLLDEDKKNLLAAAVMKMVPRRDQGVIAVQLGSQPVDHVVERLLTSKVNLFPTTSETYNFAISMGKNVTGPATLTLDLKIAPDYKTIGITFTITSYLQSTSNDPKWIAFREEGLKGFRPLAQNWKSRFLAEASLIIRANSDSSQPSRQFYCLIHESKQGSTYTRHLSSVEIIFQRAELDDISSPSISVPPDDDQRGQQPNKKRKIDEVSVSESPKPPDSDPTKIDPPSNPPASSSDPMDTGPTSGPTSSSSPSLPPAAPQDEPLPASSANQPTKTKPTLVFNPTSEDVANVIYQYDEMLAILCNLKDGESGQYGRLILVIQRPSTDDYAISDTLTLNVQQGQKFELQRIDGGPFKKDQPTYTKRKQKGVARLRNDSDVKNIYGVEGTLKTSGDLLYVIFDAAAAGDSIEPSNQVVPGKVPTTLGYSDKSQIKDSRVFWLFRQLERPEPIIAIWPGLPPKDKKVTDT
jgi:hypothetical protein